MSVEVAYAKPQEQLIISVELAAGSTCRQAIEQSRILEHFPEIDLEHVKVGVFGKLKPLEHVLQAGDRVEIYRPLIADPKEVRKKRAAAKSGKKSNAAAAGDQ